MAINPRRVLLIPFTRFRIGNYLQGGIKKFHRDVTSGPVIPFMRLHDPESFFIISKTGSALKYFQPEIPKLDKVTITKTLELYIKSFLLLRQRLLQRSKEFDVLLFSNGALQAARVGGLKSLTTASEVISTEMVKLSEKLKTGVNEVGAKVNKITEDIPLDSVKEKWKVIKEKLPEWQNNIATKLQTIQEAINKRLNYEKNK